MFVCGRVACRFEGILLHKEFRRRQAGMTMKANSWMSVQRICSVYARLGFLDRLADRQAASRFDLCLTPLIKKPQQGQLIAMELGWHAEVLCIGSGC